VAFLVGLSSHDTAVEMTEGICFHSISKCSACGRRTELTGKRAIIPANLTYVKKNQVIPITVGALNRRGVFYFLCARLQAIFRRLQRRHRHSLFGQPDQRWHPYRAVGFARQPKIKRPFQETTMKNMTRAGILIVFLSITLSAFAAPVNVESSPSGNMYISGGEVKVATAVPGDLLAAGGRVSVEREVGADAAVAGGSVDVRAPIGQDLRVAAGTANIDANVGGELVAAGGTVRVADTSAIAGSAWLAGSDVTLAGKVGKGAKIVGNKIAVSGEIDGDTSLRSGHQIAGRDPD
jgi:hypothetical protein